MSALEEREIRKLLTQMEEAWNRGDAAAYAARFRPDGTFTNVNGTLYEGHSEFQRRHEETFTGYLKGSTITFAIRKLRFPSPDIALADINVLVSGTRSASSLLVLLKEQNTWWISAYHSVWRLEETK